jgi:hypothetical protein
MALFACLYPDDGSEFDTWLPVIADDEKKAAEKTLELFEKHARSPSFIRLKRAKCFSEEPTAVYFIHRTEDGVMLDKFV